METDPNDPGEPQSPEGKRGSSPGSIRALLNRHRKLATFGLILFTVAALGWTTWQMWPEPRRLPPPTKAFYTVDDGVTFFVDDAERLPPFDHGGKPAVRAILFSCDGGKTRFTGYLEKLPEAALQRLVDAGRDLKTIDDDEVALTSGWLTKRAGEKEWVNSKDDPKKYAQVRKVSCPGGQSGIPIPIYPDEPK